MVALVVLLGLWWWSGLQTQLLVPTPSTMVVDRYDRPIAEVLAPPPARPDDVEVNTDDARDREHYGYWPLPAILPLRLVVATIETEDRRFYEHAGISPSAVGRALRQNLSAGRVVSGASTLAMQVARMQSGRRRTVFSKAREAIEALVLVDRYGHDAVLRQYLTLAPYGARVHGAERAARFYFDKPSADLSWLQAAWIAGLPQSPTRLGPFVDGGLERGLARAHRTLRQLHARGYLSDDDLQIALHSDLGLVDRRPRPDDALHLTLRVEREVRAARRHGTTPQVVRTTVDLELQHTVTALVRENLQRVRALGATNSAALVVDVQDGATLAWVGSADYFDDEDHGAIDYLEARRSPGSALKPLLYALALDPDLVPGDEAPLTVATPLEDIPMDVVASNGRSYLPQNINHIFLGPMSLRSALGNSRNIPALRITGRVGVERALRFFADAGVEDVDFTPGRYGLGLALGNLHVTPHELADLYLTLAHDGRKQVLSTSDLDRPSEMDAGPHVDDVLHHPALLNAGAATLVRHILSDPGARQPSFPIGSPLDYEHAVAVKTGTSQGYRDGWTVAVSDRLVVVVWVGNHDWRRMNHLGGLAGTAEAAHAIVDVVTPKVRPHVSSTLSAAVPPGSEQVEVCALSGLRAGPHCPHRRSEIFLPGTTPHRGCGWHRQVRVDRRTGDLATSQCPAHVTEARVVVDLPPAYARWARSQRVPLMPTRESRLCGGRTSDEVQVALLEPRSGVAYHTDPDTPRDFATVRLAAAVEGARDDDEVVFLVDNEPVARVGAPFEARWSLVPGAHEVRAVLARRSVVSPAAAIMVR